MYVCEYLYMYVCMYHLDILVASMLRGKTHSRNLWTRVYVLIYVCIKRFVHTYIHTGHPPLSCLTMTRAMPTNL